MAVHAGPKINDEGLVLALDATNERSYPGTGTTWFDLSGNGNHAQLYNSPVYNGEYFSFDGTNQYARTISNLDLSSYNSVTCTIEFKPTPNTGSSAMIYEHTTNWNTVAGGFGQTINSTGIAYSANECHSNHRPAGATWARNHISTTNENVWITQSAVFSQISDSTGRYVMENGEIKPFFRYSASTATNGANSFTNAVFYIASRAGVQSFFNGYISSIKINGLKLSVSDHTQNFEATRDRYGI